ncbi:glycosyl hydrolase [Flagelloscypha sp. PMI_526]|nr:glycosyl hydrolase [Flagelloscypha sp. PMI_526]
MVLFALLANLASLALVNAVSTTNPILPGFHPDPSCIFEPNEEVFFCATSTFNAFPGIPILASKDLVSWRQIGNQRKYSDSTSGIWAPALRVHDGVYYLFTTLVLNRASPNGENDPARYDNATILLLSGTEDGTLYMQGGTNPKKGNHVDWFTLDLDTMETTEQTLLWAGIDRAAEGPHIYYREPYYYLLCAEGGTGATHKVTMARSENITGPWEAAPANPLLTSTSGSLFQTVGHADLFQDSQGNWWSSALSTRSGNGTAYHPMGRETVLTSVSWPDGQDFPTFEPIGSTVGGPDLPKKRAPGKGPLVGDNDTYTTFDGCSTLPIHFLHWRLPDTSAYILNPEEKPRTLKLSPSSLNLTGLDGETATSPQTFLGRRQAHTLFEFTVQFDYVPVNPGDEVGVTVFTSQARHIAFGLRCPTTATSCASESTLHIYSSTSKTDVVVGLPSLVDSPTFTISCPNVTNYNFAHEGKVIGTALASEVSAGFDGAMVGVFATSNGANNTTPAYLKSWVYKGLFQQTS